MRRGTIIALILLGLALGGVQAAVISAMRREQAALVHRFGAEQLVQVEKAADELRAELEDVGEDLRFTAELVRATESDAERERTLVALLAVVKQYRLIAIYDAEGRRDQSVREPIVDPYFRPAEFDPAMAETAHAALARQPGEVETSAALASDQTGWFRAFATPLFTPMGTISGALVILVDTSPFFSKLQLIASEQGSRQIVLGPHGAPAGATDPRLAEIISRPFSERAELFSFNALLGAMRAGGVGTLAIDESDARLLGLGSAAVMAAYAPIQVEGGKYWSVATLRSTSQLRDLQQASLLRLALVSLAIVFCLVTFAGYVIVSSRRAFAIEARLHHVEELARLNERTTKILDSVPTGVMEIAADQRIVSMNRFLQRRVPDLDVGGEFRDAFASEPQLADRIAELLARARSQGRAQSLVGERTSSFGREGYYSIHAVPLDDPRSDARSLLVVEDVSEVRTLTSQLLRAEKLATVGVIAAGIAHEIGTPLGVVRARAERIAAKLGEEHALTAGARVIMDQTDRITRTIRQLLDFSRFEPARTVPISIRDAATSVIELLQFEIEPHKIQLGIDTPDDLPLISADPDRLQQVLLNLVMNACDACAENGVVTVRARAGSEGLLRIEILDNGCGIRDEMRHQVFDPFFTTKKRGKGTGLGLTIAAQIVRGHGGQIDLERQAEGGTRVVVLWPINSTGRTEPIHDRAN